MTTFAEDTFTDIHRTLSEIPGLAESIGMKKAIQFLELTSKLKAAITVAQPPSGAIGSGSATATVSSWSPTSMSFGVISPTALFRRTLL